MKGKRTHYYVFNEKLDLGPIRTLAQARHHLQRLTGWIYIEKIVYTPKNGAELCFSYLVECPIRRSTRGFSEKQYRAKCRRDWKLYQREREMTLRPTSLKLLTDVLKQTTGGEEIANQLLEMGDRALLIKINPES